MEKEERKPKWTHTLTSLSSARGNSFLFYQLLDPYLHPGLDANPSPSPRPSVWATALSWSCHSLLGGLLASSWLPWRPYLHLAA